MKISIMRIVFWITCASFAVVLLGTVSLAIIGALYGREYAASSAVAMFVTPCLTTWLGGAGILWIYGFWILGRGWAQRTNARNATLLLLLIFFGALVSPFYYWKRETL